MDARDGVGKGIERVLGIISKIKLMYTSRDTYSVHGKSSAFQPVGFAIAPDCTMAVLRLKLREMWGRGS